MTDSEYGTVLREKLKESISHPWQPLNRRPTPQKGFWDWHGEKVKLALWVAACLVVGWWAIHLFAIGL